MGRDVRCPQCGETFPVGGDATVVHCAACGKGIRLRADGPKPAEPRVAAAATAPAPKSAFPSKRVPGEVLRACPSCGALLEPKVRNCPECGVSYRVAKAERDEMREAEAAGHGNETAGIKKGVLGGLVMIAIAVAWFGLGWMAGRIFFYPPILFVIGLFAVISGLATGNYEGKKPSSRRLKP